MIFRFFFLSFCALSLLTVSAQAEILNIQKVTSSKNISAWLVEDHSVPVISIKFAFRGAGSINDAPDKQGLSQILSNTMDEGAGDLDSTEFQKQLNDYSIGLSFSSGRDDFNGSLKTLTKYKKKAFDLLTLALTEPRFDAEPVARMVEANMVRIRSNLTDPEWMQARLVNDVLYKNHPYAMNTGGTLSSLPKITPDDVQQKFLTQLAQDNLMIAVAGDITADELSRVLDDVFSKLPETSKRVEINSIVLPIKESVTLYKQNIPQTVIGMYMQGIKITDKNYPAAEVLDYIFGGAGFGSRLMDEVREKRGLTYGIYSGLQEMEASQIFSISTSTQNKNVSDVVEITKKVMRVLKQFPISESDLKDAKTYLIGSVPLALTSTDRISGVLLWMMNYGLPTNYYDTREEAIRAVTLDDVQRVAKTLLNENNMQIILVGQSNLETPAKTIKKLPNVE